MTIKGNSVLAIIPARAGSRRVPHKNLTLYNGLPLIAHAINHAKASRYIDTIAISSDSEAILAYATPPIIPILRPAYLASDHASSEAVIVHALYSTQLGDALIPPHDYLVLLQPTSPNRTAQDIDACLELALKAFNRAVSVTQNRKRNGAVYVAKTEQFLSTLSLATTFDSEYVMPQERSLDIDTHQDFLTPAPQAPTILEDLKALLKNPLGL